MDHLAVFKIDHVDLETNTCVASNDQEHITIPMDDDINVIPGQYWLINRNDRTLVTECPRQEIILFVDDKRVRFGYNQLPRELDITKGQDRHPNQEVGTNKDRLQDILEVKQLMKKDVSFKNSYVLESGQRVTLKTKIVGNSIVQTCPELDVISVSPLTSDIVKQMVHIEKTVFYDPYGGTIRFKNGYTVPVNEDRISEIMEDLVVYAKKTEDSLIVGHVRSKYLGNTPQVMVGRHDGTYFIDPIRSSIIYPSLDYQVSDAFRNRIQFDMAPVSYETFRDCLEQYLNNNSHRDGEFIRECINREYINLNGIPINLTLADKLEFEQRYLSADRHVAVEMDRKIAYSHR